MPCRVSAFLFRVLAKPFKLLGGAVTLGFAAALALNIISGGSATLGRTPQEVAPLLHPKP